MILFENYDYSCFNAWCCIINSMIYSSVLYALYFSQSPLHDIILSPISDAFHDPTSRLYDSWRQCPRFHRPPRVPLRSRTKSVYQIRDAQIRQRGLRSRYWRIKYSEKLRYFQDLLYHISMLYDVCPLKSFPILYDMLVCRIMTPFYWSTSVYIVWS